MLLGDEDQGGGTEVRAHATPPSCEQGCHLTVCVLRLARRALAQGALRRLLAAAQRAPPVPPGVPPADAAALEALEHIDVDQVDAGTCAICFDEIPGSDGRATRLPRCGHTYHEECILPWLRDCHATCPVCRTPLVDAPPRPPPPPPLTTFSGSTDDLFDGETISDATIAAMRHARGAIDGATDSATANLPQEEGEAEIVGPARSLGEAVILGPARASRGGRRVVSRATAAAAAQAEANALLPELLALLRASPSDGVGVDERAASLPGVERPITDRQQHDGSSQGGGGDGASGHRSESQGEDLWRVWERERQERGQLLRAERARLLRQLADNEAVLLNEVELLERQRDEIRAEVLSRQRVEGRAEPERPLQSAEGSEGIAPVDSMAPSEIIPFDERASVEQPPERDEVPGEAATHDEALDEAALACGLRASWETPGRPLPSSPPRPLVAADATADDAGGAASLDPMEA